MKQSCLRLALGLGLIPFLMGCPAITLPGGPQAAGLPIGSSLQDATALRLDSNGKAVVSGTIQGSKVDVYDLGPVNPGDHIIVSVRPGLSSGLDPTIAIFDSNSELFALNDDANPASGGLDSAIDDYFVTAGNHHYLAITKFHFSTTGGTYDGNIEIRRNQTKPTPGPQTLLLNFAGGTITIPNEGTFTFGPFNAADIDPAYAGKTAAIKATITATVRQKYSRFGMTVISSDDAPGSPTQCGESTIHFGAFSQTKFGVSVGVDGANLNLCDDGIVFTDNFDKPFAVQPSADGIGVAIGNVAAHEAGHLLGLNHVADVTDLMDTTGSASTLLADQEFKNAPLSVTIFPFGNQDGVALLNRVIPKP